MKKKFLGIVAVAFLGIGAAFATTTSTVYFTSSGTLTKYEDVLDGVIQTDNDPSNGTRPHSNESNIGIAKVFTSFESGTDSQKVTGVYMGKEVTKDDTTNPLRAIYSRTGRIANPNSNTNYSLSNPPYIYKEIYLENLRFSKAGDHYFIPIQVYGYNNGSNSVLWYWNDLGVCYNNSTNYLYVFTQPTTINLTSNYTCTYQVLTVRSMVDNSILKTSSGAYTTFQSGFDYYTLYLYIYVTQDFEGDYNTKFNNITINTLNFDDTPTGNLYNYYF